MGFLSVYGKLNYHEGRNNDSDQDNLDLSHQKC